MNAQAAGTTLPQTPTSRAGSMSLPGTPQLVNARAQAGLPDMRASLPNLPDFLESNGVAPTVSRPGLGSVSRVVPLGAAAVREALEDAGVEAGSMTREELRQIGVIVGSGGGSQEFTEEQYRLYYSGKQKLCSVYAVPTSTIGTLASEISMQFGFRGMSHIVSTGCTSSTDAIGYAFRNIQAGVLDMMVAGGVDAPIAPLILRGFIVMRIMSTRWNSQPERASRPFSRTATGL